MGWVYVQLWIMDHGSWITEGESGTRPCVYIGKDGASAGAGGVPKHNLLYFGQSQSPSAPGPAPPPHPPAPPLAFYAYPAPTPTPLPVRYVLEACGQRLVHLGAQVELVVASGVGEAHVRVPAHARKWRTTTDSA